MTRQPGDDLKYISLSEVNPLVYLSFGANLRERFEAFDAAQFGTGANRNDDYVLSRLEVHSDLRLGPHVQMFAQMQSDFAFGKEVLTPVDQNRLDLEQAFVAVRESVGDGVLTLRVGRQQIAFDLQRFISARDGPNVRQSYDAVWIDYERGPWRFIALWSHPVQTRDNSPFDDYSSPALSHGGIKLEWQVSRVMSVSATWSRFIRDDAHFPRASGNESRDILDTHCAGAADNFDWDVEAMGQKGHIGAENIRAWAFGSVGGYTLVGLPGHHDLAYRRIPPRATAVLLITPSVPSIRSFRTVPIFRSRDSQVTQICSTRKLLSPCGQVETSRSPLLPPLNGVKRQRTRSTRCWTFR